MKSYWQKKKQAFYRSLNTESPISDVLRVDEANEVDAQTAGLKQADANRIWAAVEDVYRTGMHPGIGFAMRYKGQLVFNRTLGHSKGVEPSENAPLTVLDLHTPICQYSASKAVMAMLVHKLAEEGHVNLLDSVARYIPEFGQNGKKDITILQMLCHHGGFPTVKVNDTNGGFFTREEVLADIYAAKANSPEGREQAYHAISSGFVADELIRVTLGQTIADYMNEKIRQPMGMEHFTYGLAEEDRESAAKNYVTGIKNPRLVDNLLSQVFGMTIEQAVAVTNTDKFMEELIPSANLYATAEEMSRFFQMLLAGGGYQGQQIFKPETIQIARREACGTKFDKSLRLPMRFSAGFMLGGKPAGVYGLNTHEAFGHIGFSNIFCWADPQRDISVAFVTTGKPVIGNHLIALPKLLHTISSTTAN